MRFFREFAKKVPELEFRLKQASIIEEPEAYIKKIFMTALLMSVALTLVLFLFLLNPAVILLVVVFFPMLFSYFLKYVDVKIKEIKGKIDSEIVFAGRFLIIEIESGVPLDQAFENIKDNYDTIGVYFNEILSKVFLGTELELAINETMLTCPSHNLRKILWQVTNSIKTGSNISHALTSVIDQIVLEQQISVKEYGKKLNPMAMFYLMGSVIIPSLGTTMLVVLATFLGLNINLTVLLMIAGGVGLVQMMFMSAIKSSRPPISI